MPQDGMMFKRPLLPGLPDTQSQSPHGLRLRLCFQIRGASSEAVAKVESSEMHPSGAKKSAEEGREAEEFPRSIPQRLKPTLVLRHLRHD
jgi:hypothetical protein